MKLFQGPAKMDIGDVKQKPSVGDNAKDGLNKLRLLIQCRLAYQLVQWVAIITAETHLLMEIFGVTRQIRL